MTKYIEIHVLATLKIERRVVVDHGNSCTLYKQIMHPSSHVKLMCLLLLLAKMVTPTKNNKKDLK
jgi:hypothetical protein